MKPFSEQMGILCYLTYKGGIMTKQYRYGREKEQRVAKALRNRGASVKSSKGSKGPADLKAKFPTGTKWNIQVKSSRTPATGMPSSKDLGRLKQNAAKTGATPVIAKVTPKGIAYKSARTGRTLKPPKKK